MGTGVLMGNPSLIGESSLTGGSISLYGDQTGAGLFGSVGGGDCGTHIHIDFASAWPLHWSIYGPLFGFLLVAIALPYIIRSACKN